MTITINELQQRMHNLTSIIFTMPDLRSNCATEIWIKFRNEGRYVCINFESPLPKKIIFHKLIGAGNALNTSDYKKDNELKQYNNTSEIKTILENSVHYRGNMDQTVLTISKLFDTFKGHVVHY